VGIEEGDALEAQLMRYALCDGINRFFLDEGYGRKHNFIVSFYKKLQKDFVFDTFTPSFFCNSLSLNNN